MATAITDRQVRGGDWSVYLTRQTVQGQMDANPVWEPMRRSSGRVKKTTNYVQTSEVTLDNNPADNVQDGREIVSEVESPATRQSIKLMIEAIYAQESAVDVTSSTIAFTATGLTSTDGSFASLSVGDRFWPTGSSEAENNRSYKVTAKADSDTISTYPAPPVIVAAGDAINIVSNKATNANVATYFAQQNRVTDLSRAGDVAYQTAYDGLINSFVFTVGESGEITSSANIQFGKEVLGYNAVAGQTDSAPNEDTPLSATQNITDWIFDGETFVCSMKSLTINISNENVEDKAAGCVTRYERGQLAITADGVSRSSVNNSMRIAELRDDGQRVEIGLELDHGEGGKTFIVLTRGLVSTWDSGDGQGVISSDEFTITAEKNRDLGYAIGVFRNWS